MILLVLANTMIMSARERMTEYAVLRTLGFSSPHIAGLIAGESLLISFMGGALGLILMFPVVGFIAKLLSNFFPVFRIEITTLLLLVALALVVGLFSALIPIYTTLNVRIVDALRQIE